MDDKLIEKLNPAWMNGQRSLTMFLIGIILCLSSVLAITVVKSTEAIRHKNLMIAENLLLQEKNEKLKHSDFEFQRLLFKEQYYAKRNENLSRCLNAAWNSGNKYGISPNVVMWIQYVESRHQPDLVSNKGAMGVMQVMYSVWHKELEIDISRIFEIEYNTDLGTRIAADYLRETKGNVLEMLKMYNGGYKFKESTGTYPIDVIEAGTTKLKLVKNASM